MSTTPDHAPTPGGADESWDAERVARWLRERDQLERQLQPISEFLFDAARLAPGERVLDVGCGTGPTTHEAARLVGPEGAVIGLDVSADMIEAAAATDPAPDSAPIEWVVADSVSWDPSGVEPVEVVISRFGMMFFSDPVRAFTNLAKATGPGGRLAGVVWARRNESEFFELPYRTVADHLAAQHVEFDEPRPDFGPFSLYDPTAVEALLTAAGWIDPRWTPHRLTISIGGGLPPAAAAKIALDLGAARAAAEHLDDDGRAAVLARLTAEFEQRVGPSGHVRVGASVGVITARIAPTST